MLVFGRDQEAECLPDERVHPCASKHPSGLACKQKASTAGKRGEDQAGDCMHRWAIAAPHDVCMLVNPGEGDALTRISSLYQLERRKET